MIKVLSALARILHGGARAFARFPAAMTGATAIAVIATIRVQLETRRFDKLLNSLQLACLFGAILALALTVLVISQTARSLTFWLANLAALLCAGVCFLLLYLPSGDIRSIAIARIVTATAISFVLFLLFISRRPEQGDYSQSVFMTLKSATVALIYALFLLGGLFFTAFAVKSLLYQALSEKVYPHIAIWCGFCWFAFFLGSFPSFRQDVPDDRRKEAQKQPRFIEMLFAYVLIPLMAILTAVLLLWSFRILIVGEWPVFDQLVTIFTAYALFGLFLAIMVSHLDLPVARWFRRLYPAATLVFLVFEAYAIWQEIGRSGLKTDHYFILVLWLFAVVSALAILFLPPVRYRLTAWLAIILAALTVLPITGYQQVPLYAQSARLKAVLDRNNMLDNGTIRPASAAVSAAEKAVIIDAASFLLWSRDARPPAWFSASIQTTDDFAAVFGFDPGLPADPNGPAAEIAVNLTLPAGSMSIDGYQAMARFAPYGGSVMPIVIQTQNARYEISVSAGGDGRAPVLTVRRGSSTVIRLDLANWLDDLAEQYRGSGKGSADIVFADMVLPVEQADIRVLVVFSSINVYWRQDGSVSRIYSVYPDSVYLADE